MTEVQRTEYFNCSLEQLYKLLTDYESYPTFLKEVQSCRIIKSKGDTCWVEYEMELIRIFKYVNKHTHNGSNEIHWVFESGDLFQSMEGSWKLTQQEGVTKAQYSLRIQWGLFMPRVVSQKILNIHLPALMKSYHRQVEKLYGRQTPRVFETQQEEIKREETEEEKATSKSPNQVNKEATQGGNSLEFPEVQDKNSFQKASFNWGEDSSPESLGNNVSDMIQKFLAMGLSTQFLSEDQIKQYLSTLSLPKELFNPFLKGIQKSKKDFMGRVSGEIQGLFEQVDWNQEFQKLFRDNKISLKIDIDFVPKDEKPNPSSVPNNQNPKALGSENEEDNS